MESVINKQLSGVEIRKAIMHDIEMMLSLDSRFAPHVAYNGFSHRSTIEVKLNPNMGKSVERVSEGADGETVEEIPATLIVAEREEDEKGPNSVRMQTGQKVPVLVSDAQGRTSEEYISYSGHDAKGKAILGQQNKYVGGAANGQD